MKRSEIDNSDNNEITCPYCGCELSDSCDYDELGELECEECGKIYSFLAEWVVTYSTTRNCEDNDEECEFAFIWHVTNVVNHDYDKYECTKCDKYHVIPHGEEFDVSKSVFG